MLKSLLIALFNRLTDQIGLFVSSSENQSTSGVVNFQTTNFTSHDFQWNGTSFEAHRDCSLIVSVSANSEFPCELQVNAGTDLVRIAAVPAYGGASNVVQGSTLVNLKTGDFMSITWGSEVENTLFAGASLRIKEA